MFFNNDVLLVLRFTHVLSFPLVDTERRVSGSVQLSMAHCVEVCQSPSQGWLQCHQTCLKFGSHLVLQVCGDELAKPGWPPQPVTPLHP